ncbi:hypothetical protein [Streptomyces violascens]|uniref:Uncharacterized protein n=1 Tax=Streptomyces violascens TaxID=67381 RepID=A0ABQ3QWZ9_9ACTN|nr:hypothetical protein [Streptomyces violascens]GGU12393.1 hypothetical protein GCM10010289_37350 [Streptomyces violascens]GHI41785.1 hypothetical protein Sviol_61930 [Streptomyces violascens]
MPAVLAGLLPLIGVGARPAAPAAVAVLLIGLASGALVPPLQAWGLGAAIVVLALIGVPIALRNRPASTDAADAVTGRGPRPKAPFLLPHKRRPGPNLRIKA